MSRVGGEQRCSLRHPEEELWPGAPAATPFQVDSTADAPDAKPGDGVCQSARGGCTLRAAVMEANASRGANAIRIPAGIYRLEIAGRNENGARTGDLDVTDSLSIRGAGSTIVDGGALDRVFEVLAPASLNVSRLTI